MLARPAQAGLTIIELMIGLAILALLLMLGVPSYSAWIQNTRIRNSAEAALNGIQLARAEAVRRNLNVELTFGAGTSWAVKLASSGEEIQARSGSEGSSSVTTAITPAGATKITFNSLGRVAANADGSNSITQVNVSIPGFADARQLNIVIPAGGGTVRMCDPHPNVKDGDPRKC